MAHVLRMPEIAANMTHAVLDSWAVDEGSTVSAGDLLAEIETEKALVEYSAEHGGILHEILAKPGTEVRVGEPIAIMAELGEYDINTSELLGSISDLVRPGGDALADSLDVDPPRESKIAPSKFGSLETTTRQFMSPIVRKLAKESETSLELLTGSGPNGRVTKRDYQNFVDGTSSGESKSSSATAAPTVSDVDVSGERPSSTFTRIPHTSMRKAIARRLSESKANVPHFYLTSQCRVDRLLELRRNINEGSDTRISITDFVVKAAAAAFVSVPDANVVWTDDSVLKFDNVDISIAIATKRGLVSPVLRGVESLSLSNVSKELSTMIERAHTGRLRQHELEGGSFAITNLGMFGTIDFSAILNPPQSGILAVGAVHQAAVVADGELTVANVMNCTMSVDHRAVDGALAAQWLAQFTRFLENPATALV